MVALYWGPRRLVAFAVLSLSYFCQPIETQVLDPSCAPGGNFDLSNWSLQLPYGAVDQPVIVSSAELAGCGGFQNYTCFFTESGDGALVMKVPAGGCVTTPGSQHCRTELRESNPSSWDPNGPVNRLTATLAVIQAGGSACIGQVHIADSVSTKPVAELYYNDTGAIWMGVEQTIQGQDQVPWQIGNVPVGQVFSYEIRYENNVLSVGLNGGSLITLPTYQLGAPLSYFKAGNYPQGTGASDVHFFAISATHATNATATIPLYSGWPPASATTASRSGLGPFNIMTAVDHTLPLSSSSSLGSASTVSASATPPAQCSPSPPAINANTVTLALFADHGCCTAFETIKMGSLDSCHNSTQPVSSFAQAVDGSMFGRNIQILMFSEQNCQGTAANIGLTNAAQCWDDSGADWQSFMIHVVGSGTASASKSSSQAGSKTSSKISSTSAKAGSTSSIKASPTSSKAAATTAAPTCPTQQPSCDASNCAGTFDLTTGHAVCTGSLAGCACQPTSSTCGNPQSCDNDNCAGAFSLSDGKAYCTNFFEGCECTPTSNTCGSAQSCDKDSCDGAFNLKDGVAYCTNFFEGCECAPTSNTCGPSQSCDKNSCAGAFSLSDGNAYCTGFFKGCECTPTTDTCGDAQSCDKDHCDGTFNMNDGVAYCTNFFRGCECKPTFNTCGPSQSCDKNNCAGAFSLSDGNAYCTNFFKGCQCSATSNTCGKPQSCDKNSCDGAFNLNNGNAYCTNFFWGCECAATSDTCGSPQSCDKDNCRGSYSLSDGKAYCTDFFDGCACEPTTNTCGQAQSCDGHNCKGAFNINNGIAYCTDFFDGCQCIATSNTCGSPQSCDKNNCDGSYDSSGVARCQGNFKGCQCNPTSSTCGAPQSCDKNGCDGGWDGNGVARCQGNFAGCVCLATSNTCGAEKSCYDNGCNGAEGSDGNGYCQGKYAGCRCILDSGSGSTSGGGSGGGPTGSGGSGGGSGGSTGTAPDLLTINLAVVYESLVTSFAEFDVAYLPGQNWCDASQIGSASETAQEGGSVCGYEFCVGGQCGFTFEGCGSGSYSVSQNGNFYVNCYWQNYAHLGTCGTASAELLYTCHQ